MKFKYITAILPVFIISCSSSNVATTTQAVTPENKISISSGSEKANIGAALSVNINFKDFKVKASANGSPAKTVADIQSAKLYLTTNNGANPLLASNLKFTSGVLVYPTGNASKTYTFFNVPPGTYYAAVELFSNAGGTTNIVEPITYTSASAGDTAFGLPGGMRGLALSTNSATVASPSMAYSFSDSSTSFNVAPKLLNATGAALDTTITPETGSDTPTGGISVS